MRCEIEIADRTVIVVGSVDRARRSLARYRAAGANMQRMSAASVLDLLRHAEHEPTLTPDVIVWVEGDGEQLAAVRRLARAQRVSLLMEDPIEPTPRGHVTLVGGGPGDADLMTVAAVRALADADVVLHDRLGPAHVIAEYAPGAELIDVGKTPGHHAVPQHEIERIMLEHAALGRRVVRLKGGDPFVFGRGGEEVIACRQAGVPVTVVPGVTSAIAVPAAAGIPVTHRNVSRAFTVVSGHAPFSEEELGHLVGLEGTLVVLMGVGTLPHLAAGLQRHGMRADMPLAILERGFSAAQRTITSTVGQIVGRLSEVAAVSPATIVIGEVVGVTGDVGWQTGELVPQDAVCQDEVVPSDVRRVVADLIT